MSRSWSDMLILLITRSGFRSWCCHILTTVHPLSLSFSPTIRSRLRFATNLAFQNSALLAGLVPHRGHACQKQPSTNTATRARGKAKSGVPGNARWRRQPEMRCCRNRDRRASSVFLLPRDLTLLISQERFFLLKTSAIAGSERRQGGSVDRLDRHASTANVASAICTTTLSEPRRPLLATPLRRST